MKYFPIDPMYMAIEDDLGIEDEYWPDWVISETKEMEVCGSCDGHGRYVGFNVIEDPCNKCKGSGVQIKEEE